MTLFEALTLRAGDVILIRPAYNIEGRTSRGAPVAATVTGRSLFSVRVSYPGGMTGRLGLDRLMQQEKAPR
jgi:hypothetical protein